MYSETLEFNAYQIEIEPNRIETNRIETNRIESKRTESNRNEPNRIESKTRKNFLMLKVLELSELFEPKRIEINRIETKSIESNRTESNSEYALNSRVSLFLSYKSDQLTLYFIFLQIN
jgi:hypothetical protein